MQSTNVDDVITIILRSSRRARVPAPSLLSSSEGDHQYSKDFSGPLLDISHSKIGLGDLERDSFIY